MLLEHGIEGRGTFDLVVALSGFHGFHQEVAGEPNLGRVPGRKRQLVFAVGEVQHPPHFGADEGG